MKFTLVHSVAALSLALFFTACQGTTTDADIQQKINDELKKDDAGAALNATVDHGVATVSGECTGDSCATKIAGRVKKIKGVTDVQTHIIESK